MVFDVWLVSESICLNAEDLRRVFQKGKLLVLWVVLRTHEKETSNGETSRLDFLSDGTEMSNHLSMRIKLYYN